MKSEVVAFKIKMAEELLKDIRRDFRTGYVRAAMEKTDTLKLAATEIKAAIDVLCRGRVKELTQGVQEKKQ